MILVENLKARKKYVEKLINVLSTKLSDKTSVGTIYAKKHRRGFQYFIKTDEGIKYIKASERKLVQELVQYEYDCKVLNAAREEFKKLIALIKVYEGNAVEDIYERIPDGKKVIVKPIRLSDEEYIKIWNKQSYEPLAFREGAPEYYSLKGKRMRSKSETMIANLLDKMNINYKYEKPLKLDKLGTVHPDFTLLDIKNRKEIYLEHLGMMDDQVYRNNAINKIRGYERSGYHMGDKLIITFETLNCPIDIKAIERKIRFVMDGPKS